VGIPESAIDRHLFAFLALAGIDTVGYEAAQAIINAAADQLGVGRAHLDHSIWQYMSRRAQAVRFTNSRASRAGAACVADRNRQQHLAEEARAAASSTVP